jgi:serine protease
VGETVTLDASGSTDSDGSIERYEWAFGDGTTATGQRVTHAFDAADTYTVTLTVSDDAGGSDSVSKTIGVGTSNATPSASFTTSPSISAIDETVSFDASGSTDSDGSIERYEWDFGDGTAATGETVTHSFDSSGEYTVSLTVTDDAGATDTVAKSITIESNSSGGQCGDETKTTTTEGSLGGYWDSIEYTFSPQLSDLCQVTISLSGPSDADFDLYVTTDGRTPSTYDFDTRSLTQGSQEQVVIDDVESGQTLGILVDSYSGSGKFTTTIEALGK